MCDQEKRARTLDHELELSWLQLKIKGTPFLKGAEIEDRISGGLILKDKNGKVGGHGLVVLPKDN